MAAYCYRCGLPAKKQGEYYACAEHGMLWLLSRNAPGADALVLKDGKILLIKRANEPYAGYWAMPGGFQEFGEHPATTAIREVREETGLTIELDSILGIYVQHTTPEEYRQITVFVATPAGGTMKAGDDASDCQWFPIDNLPEATYPAHAQRITDYQDQAPATSVRIIE